MANKKIIGGELSELPDGTMLRVSKPGASEVQGRGGVNWTCNKCGEANSDWAPDGVQILVHCMKCGHAQYIRG